MLRHKENLLELFLKELDSRLKFLLWRRGEEPISIFFKTVNFQRNLEFLWL